MRKRLTYMNTLERLLLIQIFHESLTIVGREARLNWSAGIFLLKKNNDRRTSKVFETGRRKYFF